MTSPFEPTLTSPPPTSSDGDEAYCPACNRSYGVNELFCPTDGTRLVKLVAKPDSLIGRIFDNRYEVRSVLGNGGMGTVYRGWQLSVDREVAIKVIHPKLATVRSVAKRFLREARLSSRLQHPAIVSVYDFGQGDDGVLYIVMEFLRGRALADELKRGQPMTVQRLVRIGTQICDALEAAHAEGIVHRDLKPHNVMLLEGDRVKVLDFGLAKSFAADDSGITGTDALLGTPQYMPPEQILGKPIDQRADIYAFGCMLYQMIAGRTPFDGNLPTNALLGMHLHDSAPPLPDEVPRPLASLVARCLAKDPLERPASAALVRMALEALAEGPSNALLHTPVPTPLAESVAPPSLAPPAPRKRTWIAAVAAIVVGLGAGGIGAKLLRSGSHAAAVANDAPAMAAPVTPAIDAAVAVPVAVPVDAAPAIAVDAAVKASTPPTHRHLPPHAKPDAGDALPEIDIIPTGK
ncbi:MAG TPA: serine/threonine-protein kinase [Kofleriaceae bacterium]